VVEAFSQGIQFSRRSCGVRELVEDGVTGYRFPQGMRALASVAALHAAIDYEKKRAMPQFISK